MAKNKDPAVLFYTRDFLADTTLWNYEDLGRYIKLLCLQHLQEGLSEEDFMTIAEGHKRVIEKFDLCEDGLYRNSRMAKEAARREKYKAILSENGSKGGRPKKNDENQEVFSEKPKGFEKQNQNESTRVANANVNTDINDKEDKKRESEGKEKITPLDERFNSFWSAYPKKVGKAYAKQCFDRLKPTAELTRTMLNAISEQKKSAEWTKDNGQFIPHPSTWLNQGRWEDEISTLQEAVNHSAQEVVIPKFCNKSADDMFEAALKRTYGLISKGG